MVMITKINPSHLSHRLDSITIADPIKSATMDFLLEPFREDIMPYDAPLFHAVGINLHLL